MIWHRQIAVEFNHCDPAGIVFYPRYFEMLNSVIENFFGLELGYSFARMIAARHGVPMVRIEAEFLRPSRLGDVLDFALGIGRIGRTSVTFDLTAQCDGPRLRAQMTLVWVTPGGQPAPWPTAIYQQLHRVKEFA